MAAGSVVLFDARGYDSKAMVISDSLVYECKPAHHWRAVDPGGSHRQLQLHSPLLASDHALPTELCPFESTKTVRLLRIF